MIENNNYLNKDVNNIILLHYIDDMFIVLINM